MKKTLIFLGVMILCVSCATLFSGTKANVNVYNDAVTGPVNLTVDGITQKGVYLPAKVQVNRGFKSSIIEGENEKGESGSVSVEKKFNSTTLLNIILGGIPGMAIDAATGAITSPNSKSYYLPMTKRSNYVMRDGVPTQQSPKFTNEEQVTRANAGQSSLESIIIRWYFDSDPKGARIYWRIISSVPDEVKNTNELWLGSTPFEETRTFNIIGLTYDNAKDVQIEIKVRQKGYIDQSKRFNVRQAIDQQEISSFFDMIKLDQ